jgi:hypothetical protein
MLAENWTDKYGVGHKGMVDRDYSPEMTRRYPDAVPKLKMIEPSKYRSEMFEAMIKMIEADLITFPDNYNQSGFLSMMEIKEDEVKKKRKQLEKMYVSKGFSGDELEEKVQEDLDTMDLAKVVNYDLSADEEAALGQIDLMKAEALAIVRIKRPSGKDNFQLAANKDADMGGALHDDRVYTLAMLSWILMNMRNVETKKKRERKSVKNLAEALPFRKPKGINGMF